MSYVNDMIGTPYRDLDCYALVRKVSSDLFGAELPAISDYAVDPAFAVRTALNGYGWVEVSEFMPGAVAVLGTTPFDARHVGICMDDGQVLHTCRKYGAIIQSIGQLRMTGYVHLHYYIWRGNC